MSVEDKEFTEIVRANIWHDGSNLCHMAEKLYSLATMGLMRWHWSRGGSRLKYLNIRIDMRDGGFIITGDDGKRVSLEQIERDGTYTVEAQS